MSCLRLLRPQPLVTRTCVLSHMQTRSVRKKRGVGSLDASIKRDERLLKRLEAQLAAVQANIKNEEEETKRLLQKYKKNGSSLGPEDLQEHSVFFWEKVLTKDDRRMLASHGINSFDQLVSVYNAVKSKLSQPPHPKIGDLDSKSQCAYEVYQSMPLRLHNKDRSWFNGWF